MIERSFSRKLKGISLKLKFFPSSGSERRTFHVFCHIFASQYDQAGNKLKYCRRLRFNQDAICGTINQGLGCSNTSLIFLISEGFFIPPVSSPHGRSLGAPPPHVSPHPRGFVPTPFLPILPPFPTVELLSAAPQHLELSCLQSLPHSHPLLATD